jgi:AcrR family transcriptional regulator
MTASVTSERPGKRDRLIAGARETIHRQGFEATTIADIAQASDVPAGNVYYYYYYYYYFKSKDELVAAAIDSYEGSPEDACPAARVAARSGGAVRLPERELVLGTRQAR